MKLTKVGNLMVLGLALTMMAVGCKKRPIGVTDLPGGARTRPNGNENPLPPSNPLPPPSTADIGSTIKDTDLSKLAGNIPAGPGHPGWNSNPDALKGATVYFEFDKASIKSSEQAKLTEVANYLKSNANAAVRVEGNCDERGTEEYNRSLGERRALAA